MKLVKLFNKLSAVALAASLVVGFASCSTTTDDPFNPNAPLTLEEYVKSEIKKAIENGGAPAKPEDPSELEFESRTSLMDKIQLNNEKTEDAWGNGTKISSANPLQASEGYGWDKENGQISLPFAYDAGYFGENTHIIIEADDSALNYNADAAIKIEFKVENPSTGHSNEMNITSKFKDGVAIIPISEIGFTDSCQFLLTFRAKGTVTIKNIDMAKAKGQSAPEPTPGEEEKPGKPSGSGSLKEPKSLEFHVNANSTNAENTMIFVKYDRSAYGAEEEVKVTDAELNLYINDVKVKTYNEIVFVLDEYGAEITSRGPIEDPKAMKEYKAKLSVGKAVKSGETVKIELVKASVVKVGAASDKITLANLQFALIDTDESVKYYKELAPNAEQFQNICTLEDLTTGEDTESKPGEEQKPGENPTPTPDEKPEPGEESARPAIGDVVYSATGDSLTVVLPQNIYGDPAISHGIQVTKVGILPKGAKAGETYKIVLKGTASGEFSANVQFLNKGWQGLGDEATVANFTTEDFNITAYYTFGFDTEDGYMFVIGNDDAECTEKTLTLTEFSITRENKPAGGEEPTPGEEPAPAPGEEPAPAPGEEPTPTPGEEPAPAPGEEPTPTPGEEPAPTPGEEPTPVPDEEEKPGSGENPAVKSIKLIKNEYAKTPQTQVKIPSGLTSLLVGDKVKVAFSGTADREIGNVELMIVDTTKEADYWTALSETKKDNFLTDINFEFVFEITTAPIGTGADSMVFAINGLDSDEAATIKCTSFYIEKIANEKPAGGEGDNGAGESTSKTYGLCKKYTVTTTKDVVAGDFAFVLQIDNDGEQSADGLKIDVTDFEMEVQVGDEKPFTYKNPKIQMIPNQWASPNYGVTDCRFKLDGEKTIPSRTVITVQVTKATVSNKAKADSIIYVFNEDGVGGYNQYVAPSDNYKPIFAANEI